MQKFKLSLKKDYSFRRDNDLNLICTKHNGKPIESRAIGHLFSRRARPFGYNVTFHGLWHAHFSMLIKAGVPINTISARVGRSTPSIPMIYILPCCLAWEEMLWNYLKE